MLVKVCKEGEFGENVIVEGFLVFDLVVLKEVSEIKGFKSEVFGDVDIILVLIIEVGNGIGKVFIYMVDFKLVGIIMGVKVFIVLVLRVDLYEFKLYFIVYGVIVVKNMK